MDQLLDLGEELDLADPAATALQIIARAEFLPLVIMVADPGRDVADFVDHAKIEASPPDERPNGFEELAPEPEVPCAGPGADKRGPLPRQRRALVIGNRRIQRQRDRGHFGRRAKPHVDPRDIAEFVARLEQFDHPPSIADSRLRRVFARSPGQALGVEQQDEIDVGGIVELAAAELAEREHGHSGERLAPRSFGDGSPERAVDCAVGKVRKRLGHLFEREFAGQVPERHRECQPATLTPEPLANRCSAEVE